MRKIATVCLFFISLFVIFTPNLAAQVEEMELYVNVGLMTDDSFSFDPFIWSAGAVMDIQIGNMLLLSPECSVVFHDFDFEYIWLNPAVLLNARFSSFFAGAGISKHFKLAGEFAGNSDLLLKINGGFKSQKYRLAVFLETPFDEIFGKNMVIFGVTLGFKF